MIVAEGWQEIDGRVRTPGDKSTPNLWCSGGRRVYLFRSIGVGLERGGLRSVFLFCLTTSKNRSMIVEIRALSQLGVGCG